LKFHSLGGFILFHNYTTLFLSQKKIFKTFFHKEGYKHTARFHYFWVSECFIKTKNVNQMIVSLKVKSKQLEWFNVSSKLKMLIKWLFLWRLKVSNLNDSLFHQSVFEIEIDFRHTNNSSAIFIWFRGYCQPIFGLGLSINQLTLSPVTKDHCFVESRICY
jgi:hypothetical protein